jgi:hypothetical protein
MTERTLSVRLHWPALLLAVLVFLLPWGLVGFLEARYDPTIREQILAGRVATLDSLHTLDSVRVEIAEAGADLWRSRAGMACSMLPFRDLESCRLTLDERLARRR